MKTVNIREWEPYSKDKLLKLLNNNENTLSF